MQLQFIFISIVQLLFIINQQVQTIPAYHKLFLPFDYNNSTNEFKIEYHLSTCLSDSDCHKHGWCNDGDCECEKGWITWRNSRQCSYKQSSKIMAMILSFVFGNIGMDWFILSRRDNLYILCGILKLLISTGWCIWCPLAAKSKSKNAMAAASCLSVCLAFISFIWWFLDWIRILCNKFPDGNGAPLV